MSETAIAEQPAEQERADVFPCESFKEAARHLRRPFTPAAVKFKVQATWPKDNPTGGLIVAYIDARLAVERLNLLVPHLWHDAYRSVGQRQMWCDLTIDGITRSDVGEGDGKGLVSDSLKRAAVKFGIGVSLYAIPKMILDTKAGTVKQKRSREGLTLEVTPSGERVLRDMYEHWLDAHGRQAFGEPLDHGDVADNQGDAEVDGQTPAEEPVQEAGPVIDAERLAGLEQTIRDRRMTVRQIVGMFAAAGVPEIHPSREGIERAMRALTLEQALEVDHLLQNIRPLEQAA